MGSKGVVVGIVLTTFGKGGMLVGPVPHVETFGTFNAQGLLKVVCDAVGIDKNTVHTSGNIAWSYGIESVGVDKGVSLNHLGAILESSITQGLIVGILSSSYTAQEVSAHDGVHENGYATMFTGFADKTGKVIVESGARISMTIWLGLLVVMAKLYDDIIARTNERQHSIPTAFIDEALGRTAIDGMIIHPDEGIVEVAL